MAGKTQEEAGSYYYDYCFDGTKRRGREERGGVAQKGCGGASCHLNALVRNNSRELGLTEWRLASLWPFISSAWAKLGNIHYADPKRWLPCRIIMMLAALSNNNDAGCLLIIEDAVSSSLTKGV